MSDRNVFAVARSIWTDPDFEPEPFTEREAWMWLVGAAAWKPIKARGNAGQIELQRGEFSFSIRFLAEKWDWSKSRVDRFLGTLKKRDTLRDTSRDGSQVYFIKNYNRFQVVGLPKRDKTGTVDGTRAGQQRDKEETVKQDNKRETNVSLSAFERFWKAYPRRKGSNPKQAAEELFKAAVLAGVDPEEIIRGAAAYAAEFADRTDDERRYVAQATKWLRNKHWDGSSPAAAVKSTGPPQPPDPSMPSHEELLRRYSKAPNDRPNPTDSEPDNPGVLRESAGLHGGGPSAVEARTEVAGMGGVGGLFSLPGQGAGHNGHGPFRRH